MAQKEISRAVLVIPQFEKESDRSHRAAATVYTCKFRIRLRCCSAQSQEMSAVCTYYEIYLFMYISTKY